MKQMCSQHMVRFSTWPGVFTVLEDHIPGVVNVLLPTHQACTGWVAGPSL